MLTFLRQKDCSINNLRAVRKTAATLLLLLLSSLSAWAQPVQITTEDDIANDTKKLYLIQTNAFQSFYIAPQGDNITTNNILGDYMLWYFLDAGIDNGTQYYYIVSYTENKYICHGGGTDNNDTSRGVKLVEKNSDNEERCKFKLVENNNNGTTGFYNINAKGNPTYYGLNKQNGSMVIDNKPIRLTNGQYISDTNSKWKFIPYNGTFNWPNPPFTVSNGSDIHYYRINNAQTTTNYLSVNTTNNNVTSASEASDFMVWYFIEAPTDPSTPWFKYYYIVNPESEGKYMYYNGTGTDGNNQSNAVKVQAYNSNDEDRYQFIVVLAARGDGANRVECYAIIPKLLSGILWRSNSVGPSSNIISSRGEKNTAQWQFVETDDYPSRCARPEITFSSETGKISITSATPGVTIYYTTNGDDPTNGSTQYTAPFDLGYETTTIKAIAIHQTIPESLISTFSVPQLDTPQLSFNNANNKLTITSDGDYIYYTTDGSEPIIGTSSTYSEPLTLLNATTVKAIAVKSGYYKSQIASKFVGKVATPVIQLNGRDVVSITTGTTGAEVYYTTDGTTPDASCTRYLDPITVNVSSIPFKAIAVLDDYISSDIATSTIVLTCGTPTIRHDGMTFIIDAPSFPAQGTTIRYTTDGSTPTESSTLYTGTPVPFSEYGITVSAIAWADGYNPSAVVTKQILNELEGQGTEQSPYLIMSGSDYALFVASANQDGSDKHYKVAADISASGSNAITKTFTGVFDGGNYTITGLRHPLFEIVDGGIVRNVTLQDVIINSDADTVGAIANIAKGYSRIYSCGILPGSADYPDGIHPAVTTSGNCAGGLVGSLRNDSRVVNCFSYADVSASNSAAGIVGRNTYASTALETDGKYTELRTMVVNCMFYGNITATSIYPVYGGEKITNTGATAINNYNFYRNGSTFSTALTDYNCSWPAQEENLTFNEYYRNLLNSNRELCGWWVGAPSAPCQMDAADVQAVPKDASLMAKWVLDPSVAPYPILKPFGRYYSPVNIDADASWRATANEWEGKNLGTISVTINPGNHAAAGISTKSAVDFVITDMDTIHGDFCYRKIQLPYYNTVFGNTNGQTWATKYGGNYGEYVVIGWEITSTNGAAGTFTADWQVGYNFADRYSSAKDLYSESGRIFAQGGYYYVPYDVTSITITAHWAKAIYLDNTGNSYDRVYMSQPQANESDPCAGTHFAPAGTRPGLENGQTVYNGSINSVIPNGGRVYENAIVLIGNYQYRQSGIDVKGTGKNANTDGITIMSTDLDNDDEPDNCLIWQLGNKTSRYNLCPIRFDFLTVLEMGMAMKEDGSTQYYSIGCYRPLGHFEVTETSLIHFGQFEFGNSSRGTDAPIILNGGIFDQYTKGTMSYTTANDRITYIIIGGNVSMPSFTPGAHVRSTVNYPTRHCAVNILGGRIDNVYLTGNYNEGVTPNTDNPHCYIDGGRIKQVAAAGKEGIDGDVYFYINHSKIWEFYGGSTLATKLVTGNISVNIDNSIVDKYCGGPKFGDMDYANDKTITTNATNTVFKVYYGGGNGGTSYVQYKAAVDNTASANNYNWNTTGKVNDYSAGKYVNLDDGYQANYDMEIVRESTGTTPGQAVFRTYYYSAQFSATNTGSITNNLTDCTVLTNFYGAGNLGGVNGNVTSTLTDTHVIGSAFGAGFSATIPDVTIYNRDKTAPNINVNTGIITPQSGGTSTTYTWTNETSLGGQTLSTAKPAVKNVTIDGVTKNYFYTEVPLENLGAVSGAVSLTITGSDNKGSIVSNVYGGGDASTVSSSTDPANATTTVNIQGNTTVLGDVFGGGNRGDVSGSVTVNIKNGTVQNDVYGGGALANTNYGNVTAGYGTDNETIPSTTTSTTTVNLEGGTIIGDVYGGGLGQTGDDPVEAKVYGDVTVYQLGTILVPAYDADSLATSGRIFGCNNVNGTPKGHVLVYVSNTTPNNPDDKYAISAVYGGGNKAEYIPVGIAQDDSDNTEVVIDGCNIVTIHSVYGGGNAASTPATNVTISGAKAIMYVFGGGNGAGQGNPGANVGYHYYSEDEYGGTTPEAIARRRDAQNNLAYGSGIASTNIYGGNIHHVFGGSNTKGNIRQASIAMLDELSTCPLVVNGIHGGGREAYMEGQSILEMGCTTGMPAIYGGSENADVGSDITLTLTSGHFDKVFGGNNKGGRILGSITVNIEQTGCLPITIDELYLGGNNAPYSVFGYEDTYHDVILNGDTIRQYDLIDSADVKLFNDPVLHLRSFASIGKVFGGGNGEHAIMVGDPTVEINVTKGWINGQYVGTLDEYSQYKGTPQELPMDGVIDTVFGGGNEAIVKGNTNILIGDSLSSTVTIKSMDQLYNTIPETGLTRSHIKMVKADDNDVKTITYTVVDQNGDPVAGKEPLTVHVRETVNGATITGNVYGGGNNADVTGSTTIQVGPAQ